MDNQDSIWVVLYTENHPDRDITFIGAFKSEELAFEARDRHRQLEKTRSGRFDIFDCDYTIHESTLNTFCGW